MERSAVVVLLCLAAFLQIGECLKCYSCDSVTNNKCMDPFDSSLHPVECTQTTMGKIGSSVSDMFGSLGTSLGFDTSKLSLPGFEWGCYKYTIKTNDVKQVARFCYPKTASCDTLEKQAEKLPAGSKFDFCESCESDMCNSAITPAATFTFLLFPALALLLSRA